MTTNIRTKENNKTNLKFAHELMDSYLIRTGIKGSAGNARQRYLWTDAIAVHSCFALYHYLNDNAYYNYALDLINKVHSILGKHRPDDSRTGWISGLPEEEGNKHPTSGGLRIGKRLPERSDYEDYNPSIEWERDGQYFHYLTRWFHALILAYKETDDKKYAYYAAELIQAGEKFVRKRQDGLSMCWKMNIDLSEVVVDNMGAHDPLEGLICASYASNILPEKRNELENFINIMNYFCKGMNWFSSDPLGIGGLLLNTRRAADLQQLNENLPKNVQAETLYSESLKSLLVYKEETNHIMQPIGLRLAFRECGLTLGINVVCAMKDKFSKFPEVDIQKLEKFEPMVKNIENFWLKPKNQQADNWLNHYDINSVSLASSILSKYCPECF